MPSFLLLSSLVLIVVGSVFSPFLLAFGIDLLIVSLAWLGGAPRWVLVLFGTWLLVLFVLLLLSRAFPGSLWSESELVLGLPGSTFLMLVGVWVIPIFILPLGFLVSFDRWLRR